MSLSTAINKVIEKIEELANSSENLTDLSIAGASLEKMAAIQGGQKIAEDAYSIGTPGTMGFGQAAMPDELLPAGYIKMSGHEDVASSNYGCVMDEHGSVFIYRPKFYYKMTGDIVSISSKPNSGYATPRAFIYNPKGYLEFAYLAGNEGGKMVSKPMLDPLSTHSAHNPIGDLLCDPSNNYGGWVDACAGNGFVPMSIFEWQVVQLVALAQSQSGAGSALVAYNDVAPYFPKGNLANALHDNSDTSVTFIESGYSNCALTGSGSNIAKTTDNGQPCGKKDVNGNMWKIAVGLTYLAKTGATCANGSTDVSLNGHGLAIDDIIYFGGTPSSGSTYNTGAYTVVEVTDGNNFKVDHALEREIASTDGVYSSRFFRILKTDVHPKSLTTSNILDSENYDMLDLSGIVTNNSGWTYFGNGSNSTFNFSTDINSKEYKLASCVIPAENGTNSNTNSAYGNGGIYRYLRHGMVPLVGVSWGNSSPVGVFSLSLTNYSSNSDNSVGGFASVPLL